MGDQLIHEVKGREDSSRSCYRRHQEGWKRGGRHPGVGLVLANYTKIICNASCMCLALSHIVSVRLYVMTSVSEHL